MSGYTVMIKIAGEPGRKGVADQHFLMQEGTFRPTHSEEWENQSNPLIVILNGTLTV